MGSKLIIVMVGLPARGKSYITKKISNYLNWLDIDNKLFNVGNKRRTVVPTENDANFFDPNDESNVKLREELAMITLGELISYLTTQDGEVGIFDATNTTEARRGKIVDYIKQNLIGVEYNILFLESICNRESIIDSNILLKLDGPDYQKTEDKEAALNDFKQRCKNYEQVYQPVSRQEIFKYNESEDICCFIKIIDITLIKSYNINGVLPLILSSFLRSFNVTKKKIWLFNADVDADELSIISNIPAHNLSKYIITSQNSEMSLDQVHDFLLNLESAQNDVFIQTNDQFLINGIFKYFNLKQLEIDLNYQILCLNPSVYSIEILEIPLMTRSNSNVSSTSINLKTPSDENDFTPFNIENLNVDELSTKLNSLTEKEEISSASKSTVINP